MKKTKTNRGFSIYLFKDRLGENCSIQKSSLATEDAIWIGVNDVTPKIMCRDAIKLGIRKSTGGAEDNGWCNYIIPKEVLLSSRMELTQEQVRELLPILQKFVNTGEV
ncbi:MAG: hypothetical protein WC346_20885 [Methanogenium sp.]|jgi:hypothetical protein